MTGLDWTTCPLCAERVPAASVKCMHCGSRMQQDALEIGDRLSADFAPARGVGAAGVFVLFGLFLGYALGGAALEGWRHSLASVAGAGVGLAAYLLLDGPLAHLRRSAATPKPSPEAPPEAAEDAPAQEG